MLSRQIGENEWLSNILYENEHMGGLVKHLLELSRAENPQMQKERFDFSRMVTGEVLAFETVAFDRGKVFNSQVEDGIHLVGSRIQLTQLISVLLDNAVEHATGAQIDVTLKQKGHTAILTVANEGQEIPPEKRRHLFDRFYRVDEARTAEGQHYGLGLSIARAVAQSHGGNIRLDIQGSMVIFSVTLPIKKR